jgi:hypothetical protein
MTRKELAKKQGTPPSGPAQAQTLIRTNWPIALVFIFSPCAFWNVSLTGARIKVEGLAQEAKSKGMLMLNPIFC